jgi:ParB-like nuclease domain
MTGKEGRGESINVRATAKTPFEKTSGATSATGGPAPVGLHDRGGDPGDHDRAADGGRSAADLTPTRPVSAIFIGKRARKDLGDIDDLAHSIDEYGLLQPIVISPEGHLIGGGRRLEAWKRSRFKDEPIPVHVRGDIEIAIGEHIENQERKDLTLSEWLAQWREVAPLYREAAKKRQREYGTAPGQQGSGAKLRVRDEMQRFIRKRGGDWSGKTLETGLKVMEAAEREPDKYGHLVPLMDEHGAHGAWQEYLGMQEDAAHAVSAVKIRGAADNKLIELVQRKVLPKLNRAIDGKAHLVSIALSGLRVACQCGARFDLPHRRGAPPARTASEIAAYINAHWAAQLAEDGESFDALRADLRGSGATP